MQDRVAAEHDNERFESFQQVRLRFRRAPLAAAAVWFAIGIGLARLNLHETAQVAGSLALTLAIAVLALRLKSRVAWVAVAGVWVALGVAAKEWQSSPPGQGALLAHADNLSRTVVGRVVRVQETPAAEESRDADGVPAWEATEELGAAAKRGEPSCWTST